VFWLGDLNYRINMDDAEIRKKIQEQSYVELLANDQLLLQQQKAMAFEEFVEAPINFAPTYKYDTGTTNYDTSEKRRAPAWCDRILWRGSSVAKCTYYGRHELLSSDHRPVSGLYQVNIKRVIEEKRRVIMQEIIKQLDRLENERIPQCDLSQSIIDFGKVYYMVPQTRTIQLNFSKEVNIYLFVYREIIF
jgi:inositol polyphosphate 5-phosphatase INPP5B/F